MSKKILQTKSYGRKRIRVQTINKEPSLTDQSQAAETDVNFIMSRNRYNQLPEHPGTYADLSEIGDLVEMHEQIRYADQIFKTIPAKLRAKFDNDPAKLIDYLNDPKNDDEAIAYGLREKPLFSPKSSADSSASKPSESAVSPKTKTKNQGDNDSSETQ